MPGSPAPATSDSVKTPKAAWGAPPPLRGKARSKAAGADGARPKVPPPAPPPEIPPPALFDQWLAVVKFLTGWNDQKKYAESDIRDALHEHLTFEGIEHVATVDKLCRTVVPLLLDLRSADQAIMKNMNVQLLKGRKIVEVNMLRVVTFELKRERAAKDSIAEKKKTGDGGSEVAEGAPHLLSDLHALAKTVQHFRFERGFSEGLQQLISSIRKGGKTKGGNPGDGKKDGAKAGDNGDRVARDKNAEAALAPPPSKRPRSGL